MRIMYDTRDLSYSDDGDILFDRETKDFKIIDDSEGKISSETISKRIFSNPGDWKRMPEYGSGILSLVGNDTAENVISLIKSAVTDELIKEMAFNSSEFEVKVIPLSLREYAVVVILQKGYMKVPIVVSSNISSNYFSDKNNKISSIGLGVK
jgi:hypothetical protein